MTDHDRLSNELVVVGAVYALLTEHLTSIEFVQGQDTAALIVRVPFMRSRYRLTVTMEEEQPEE